MAPTLIDSTDMGQAQQLLIPVSTGELVDKITILEIKMRKIQKPEAQKNVQTELRLLQDTFNTLAQELPQELRIKNAAIKRDLEKINQQLWDVEDSLRAHEAKQNFGQEFVQLARSVYFFNDKRAQLKRSINILCGSSLLEEKSYAENLDTSYASNIDN